ncbi:MAG TPA: S1/P1 Nuclease [Flavobacteriales bacterium]|jgi:hypothetical protein|nr:S1/P1 Nuclease [Flavobacteriales bacterium]
MGYSWGKTGHRVSGEIAMRYLKPKVRKQVEKILHGESIAMVGNYMDFIKSEPKYDYMKPWHYVTVPDSVTYAEAGTPEQGDAYMAINKFKNELINGNYTVDEAFALKCLIHLVEDIHQPLHVGNGTDRGGNDIKVEFFWKPSNLHRVWDSGIIDGEQLSYTEYANWIDVTTRELVESWQSDALEVWIAESKSYRSQVYDFPEDKKLSYRYVYDNIEVVNLRLLQSGIRLAGLLNEIYG